MTMRFPEFLRTTTFRWTLTISAVFVAAMLVLVAAIYHETVASNEARIDETMIQDVGRTIAEDSEAAATRVHARLMEDPRRVRLGGLFDADRKPVAGNMHSFPEGFKADGKVWDIVVEREDSQGLEVQTARAVGGVLRDGSTYIVGRNFDDFAPLQESMVQTLVLGLAPAIGLALFCGIVLSMRTQRRIEEIHRMAQRIMAGHLNERLPGRGKNDDFDKLVDIINAMLGQIEHLISEVKGVGDDIAHDLRTPLTRVRAALERGRDNATSLEDLRGAVDKGLNGIDQALGVTTALLRIAAIEHGQRNAGFGEVDLGTIVAAAIELYEPAAEDKGIRLRTGETATVFYKVKNRSSRTTVGLATYNVAPERSGMFFNKIACFCFSEQTLGPGETMDMPVVFYIDPAVETDEIMKTQDSITLSYTFFAAKTPVASTRGKPAL